MTQSDRRRFLKSMGIVAGAGALAGARHPDAIPTRDGNGGGSAATGRPSLEVIARLVSETPRDDVFTAARELIEQGADHRDLLGGIFLAGVQDIEPRPLGFQFHTVLMGSSAYQVAEAGRPEHRLLPAFYNLDDFKLAQVRDRRDGDWQLPPRDREIGEMADPVSGFRDAMEAWDEARATEAVAQMHERMDLDSAFELIWPYGGRCYQSIGHKMIYASHCYRTLQEIGWRHGEPALRSLVMGLLLNGPGRSSATFDPNRRLSEKIRDDWTLGEEDPGASARLLAKLRSCTSGQAAEEVVELLNDGVAPRSVWDGLRLFAFEMLMQRPGILSLHAVTNLNAMHYGFTATRRDETRRLLLLQNASFLPMFRGDSAARRARAGSEDGIDALTAGARGSAEEVFEIAGEDRQRACRMVMAGAGDPAFVDAYADATRRVLVRKARDHHDYKYAAAALEEWRHADPRWAPHLRAAGLFWLRTAADEDGSVFRRAQPLLPG